jgi:glycosyltransferase involved in cell wall biosynthesis
LGYDITAFCAPGPLVPCDEVTSDGIKIKTIPITQRITPLQDISTLLRYVRLFRCEQFHIVHTHSIKPGLYARIAARFVQTPVVIHTLHGFYFHDEMPHKKQWLWQNIERMGMVFGDHTLSQSQEDVNTALYKKICKPGRISYLGNGIQIDRFNPATIPPQQREVKRTELGARPDQKVVAISGRLVVEKGYKEFFEAARLILKEYSDIQFWAMGASQPDRHDQIPLTLLEELGIKEHVKFLGMRSDIPELLSAIDIFVLPSHGREGIPRVLMEASAMARAIVATNVRGCREAVIHNQTGLLVPARDPVALAEAVKKLLLNKVLAERLAATARQYALEHFDERDYFERIKETYEMLLTKKGV